MKVAELKMELKKRGMVVSGSKVNFSFLVQTLGFLPIN